MSLDGVLWSKEGQCVHATQLRLPLKVLWRYDHVYQQLYKSIWPVRIQGLEASVLTWDGVLLTLALETGEVLRRRELGTCVDNFTADSERLYAICSSGFTHRYRSTLNNVYDLDNSIRCIDLSSGEDVWNLTAPVWESRAIPLGDAAGGLLFFRSRQLFPERHVLHVVSTQDGKPRWTYEARELELLGSVPSHKRVVLLSDSALVCLDTETGIPVWERDCPGLRHFGRLGRFLYCYDIGSRAAGMEPGRRALYCLDLERGDLLWSRSVPISVGSLQSHPDGILYGGGRLPCALSAEDGRVIWRVLKEELPFALRDEPAPWEYYGHVLVAGDHVTAFYTKEAIVFDRRSGGLLQVIPVRNAVPQGSALAGEGRILCASMNGYLACLGPGRVRKLKPDEILKGTWFGDPVEERRGLYPYGEGDDGLSKPGDATTGKGGGTTCFRPSGIWDLVLREGAEEELRALLRNVDPRVQRAAIRALVRIRASESAPVILSLLREEDSHTRFLVSWAVVTLDNRAVISLVFDYLSPENRGQLEAALAILGGFRDRSATPRITPLLEHPDYAVTSVALHAIAWLRDDAAIPAVLEYLRRSPAYKGTSAAWRALDALVELKPKAALPDLITVLREWDNIARSGAVQALAAIGDPSAFPHLCRSLSDRDALVRRFAIRALAETGDPRAIPLLLKRLGDHAFDVQGEAALALGRMRAIEAVGPIVERLDTNALYLPIGISLKATFLEALGLIGDTSAIPAVASALDAKRTAEQGLAARTLAILTGQNWPQSKEGVEAARAWRDAHLRVGSGG